MLEHDWVIEAVVHNSQASGNETSENTETENQDRMVKYKTTRKK